MLPRQLSGILWGNVSKFNDCIYWNIEGQLETFLPNLNTEHNYFLSKLLVCLCLWKLWIINTHVSLFVMNNKRAKVFITRKKTLSSVPRLCPTLCDPMDCDTPGFPIHHQLLELAQIHIHWVGDAIQPSRPLSSPPCAFSLGQDQGQWVSSSNQVAKVLEFQHQFFQWILRVDFL